VAAAPVVVEILQDDGSTLNVKIDSLTGDFASYPISFTATVNSDEARISILSRGDGDFRIGTISLMPSDNIDGWRADVLACLKQLDIPIMRWPGGNFVSGYNWRDGLGERDQRPPRRNPAWHGVEFNDVGIHEFMNLMSMLHCEVYLAVNTGSGSAEEAAAEIEYVNGSSDTPMGKLRARNGHPDSYNVKFVAVGNEMFGTWQIGYMPEAQYVIKHNQVVDAIRKVAPDLILTAVGDVGRDGGWDKLMLETCADHMTLLSEHVYVKEDRDVAKHADLLPAAIQNVANAFRGYQKDIPQMQGKNIRIAMDEWNYWYGRYVYGELGVVYHLKDALGIARGLHAFYRNSDIFFMANYAQTVNVIGAIKATRTAASLESTGLVLAMYRAHFGTIPVPTNLSGANIDVSVAWTADKSELTVAIVNCATGADTVALAAADSDKLGTIGAARQWIITGASPMSYNTPGKDPQVILSEHDVRIVNNTLPSPPMSVTLYRFKVGS
jgi:alpha-N-arabinofuranosidase